MYIYVNIYIYTYIYIYIYIARDPDMLCEIAAILVRMERSLGVRISTLHGSGAVIPENH